MRFVTIIVGCFAAAAFPAFAQGSPDNETGSGGTAQQLSNPIASLISIPFQDNIDVGGDGHGKTQNVMDIEPVVPFQLSDDLNLISRTVIPVVSSVGATGLGDTVQSLFLSPKTDHGFTYGFGPVLAIPTATEKQFGLGQVGLGPTAVIVKTSGPILLGLLANQVWGIDRRPRGRERLDATLIQPFAAYTLPSQTSFVLDSQSSYDWSARKWTVPVNLTVNQLASVGGQLVQFGVGPRYYAVRPSTGERWGIRISATLVYPVARTR